MSDLTSFNGSQVSSVFGNQKPENDLSSGIGTSFAIVGYRGKVWSIKYRGDEEKLLRPNNEGPVNSIEAVIVGASRNISKIYYAAGWTEGATAAPDCFSNDGIVPDASAVRKQNPTCATCPRNIWGATISQVTGKPKKECQDNKRLAVVPLDNIANEVYGGPMLLRVPPASLQELAHFGNKMSKLGYPYYSFGTRISFDNEESYPKFLFTAIRPLTDAEAKLVVEWRDSALVTRVLSESTEFVQQDQQDQQQVAGAFEVKSTWSAPAPAPAATVGQTPPAQPSLTTPQSSATSPQSVQRVEPNTQQSIAPTAPAVEKRSETTAPQNGGSATTASTAPTPPSGFSGSPTQTTPPQADEKDTSRVTESTSTPSAGPSAFEQELDSMMAKLLPEA